MLRTTYRVTWHARGLGRLTSKTFRSWRGAVGWWAWLRVCEQYEARITRIIRTGRMPSDADTTPRWPTRRLRRLVREEARLQEEITRLQNAATERAANSEPER